MDLWDDESWYLLSALHVQLARDAGALTELTPALALQSGAHVFSGQFAAAEALGDEASSVSVAIGGPEAPYARLILAGWRGREAETLQLVETTGRDAAARGEGRMVRAGEYARAILYNGLGRHQDALAVAQQASKHPEEMSFPTWCLAEVIEAAARSGQPDLAAEALDRLSGMTRLSGTDFALGIEARSRALVSEGAVADSLYREAIERLGRTRAATYLARAHLVYGEWLRRERRRTDARAQLRTAHEMFVSMGAEAFAGRAGRELQAAGETARKRPVQTTGQLTAKEAQIAQLARDGLSNLEIGSHLFISHRTVEYHLRKVFTKLGITSRTQLAQVLPGDANAANPADANAANPAERSAVG
jgi:DNA-binding CsgD family transcriptional regulator